jgi:hypothetical protein
VKGWRGCPNCGGAGTFRLPLMPWPARCSFSPASSLSAPAPSQATRALAERPFISCYKPTRGEFNFEEANAIWHAYDVVREWDTRS